MTLRALCNIDFICLRKSVWDIPDCGRVGEPLRLRSASSSSSLLASPDLAGDAVCCFARDFTVILVEARAGFGLFLPQWPVRTIAGEAGVYREVIP